MDKGIIAVVSEGRTGSSLCMQTLKILGVPVAAPGFLKEHDNIRQYNPKGFYELPDLDSGIQDERYSGMAVKMFPMALKNTPPKLISKVIRMKRNREDACISMIPVLAALHPEELNAFSVYDMNCEFLDKYLVDIQHLICNFEPLIENPFSEIERIIDYLGINPSLSQIKQAYDNVDLLIKK